MKGHYEMTKQHKRKICQRMTGKIITKSLKVKSYTPSHTDSHTHIQMHKHTPLLSLLGPNHPPRWLLSRILSV